MTEEQWLACENLRWLLSIPDELKSVRKSRLALCACARGQTFWPLLASRSSRRVVEVGEAFADGATDKKALRLAQSGASAATGRGPRSSDHVAAELARVIGYQDSWLLRYGVHYFVNVAARVHLALPARLAQDTHANPFRPVNFDAACLTATVVALAQAAYDERALPSGHLDPARLAVLSDALEEAGCVDAEVLDHLRSSGPHVRGCWALDLLLGKG